MNGLVHSTAYNDSYFNCRGIKHEFKRGVDYSTCILGTIAPDAVHAHSDFRVKLKERSHLFAEGLKRGQICDEKDSQICFAQFVNNIDGNDEEKRLNLRDDTFRKGELSVK